MKSRKIIRDNISLIIILFMAILTITFILYIITNRVLELVIVISALIGIVSFLLDVFKIFFISDRFKQLKTDEIYFSYDRLDTAVSKIYKKIRRDGIPDLIVAIGGKGYGGGCIVASLLAEVYLRQHILYLELPRVGQRIDWREADPREKEPVVKVNEPGKYETKPDTTAKRILSFSAEDVIAHHIRNTDIKNVRNILIVDDSSTTDYTIRRVKEELEKHWPPNGCSIKIAVIVPSEKSKVELGDDFWKNNYYYISPEDAGDRKPNFPWDREPPRQTFLKL